MIRRINITALFLILSFCFFACAPGQGPTEGKGGAPQAGQEIQSATTPTEVNPPAEDCEQPENKNNILCQWVVASMDGQLVFPGGAGTIPINPTIDYDVKGRPVQITTFDAAGHKYTVTIFAYGPHGVWKKISYAIPKTPGRDDFQSEDTETTYYKADGAIERKISENKWDGQPTRTEEALYSYGISGFDQVVYRTGRSPTTGMTTSSMIEATQNDPNTGKPVLVDLKSYSPTGTGTAMTQSSWVVTSYSDPTGVGRIGHVEEKAQICSAIPCVGNVNPTTIKKTDLAYDGQKRIIAATITTDGVPGIPGSLPDGTADSTTACQMAYNFSTQNNSVENNPLGPALNSTYYVDFEPNDLFSTYTCNGPVSFDTTVTWKRFWEILPGAQAPGS